MKNTVIANWGPSGQGKSATIKKVAEKLICDCGAKLIDKYEDNTFDYNWTIQLKNDVKIGIEIKIGIESQGDPGGRSTGQALRSLFSGDRKSNIIVCASRTRGETVDVINDLCREFDYDLIWVNNYRSSTGVDHDFLNELSATHIIDLINQIVSKK
jgi:hypothetical protein